MDADHPSTGVNLPRRITVGRNIIHRVREDVIEELAKLKRGIEADNFTKENIDALVARLRRV